jgi:hypothetical protein
MRKCGVRQNVFNAAFRAARIFTHYTLIMSQLHQTSRQYYCSHVSRSLRKHNSLLIRIKDGHCIENYLPHVTAASRKENKRSDVSSIFKKLQAIDARHKICTLVGETGPELPGVGQRSSPAGFFRQFHSAKQIICGLTTGKVHPDHPSL